MGQLDRFLSVSHSKYVSQTDILLFAAPRLLDEHAIVVQQYHLQPLSRGSLRWVENFQREILWVIHQLRKYETLPHEEKWTRHLIHQHVLRRRRYP